jgi:hypothetical protein
LVLLKELSPKKEWQQNCQKCQVELQATKLAKEQACILVTLATTTCFGLDNQQQVQR